MRKGLPAWLMVMLAIAGLLLVGPAGWVYVSVTARPLYPNGESVPSVSLSAPPPEWASPVEQAQKIVRASVAQQNLPGLSVAVGINGDLIWAEGFGFADLKTSVPVTPDHRFRIGTASAVLTSAAAGLLLEEGRLKLDDEIQTYVPALPKQQQPVTLRQLMGHTPGVSPGGDEAPLFTKHCERPAEMLRHFAGSWRLFEEPGTQYLYSIYDWILVSAAIETAADQPFLQFMRDRIFDPLEMRNTTSDAMSMEVGEDFPLVNMIRELIYDPEAVRDSTSAPTKKPVQGRVTSYFPRFASDPKYGLHVMRPIDYSCYAGSSVFLSTPSDLVRFGMAVNRGNLLQPATITLLQTSQRLASGVETGYGLGWYVRTVPLAGKQTRVIGHDGELTGRNGGVFHDGPRVWNCRSCDGEHLLCRHGLPSNSNRRIFSWNSGKNQVSRNGATLFFQPGIPNA